jgi:hypothetical protein
MATSQAGETAENFHNGEGLCTIGATNVEPGEDIAHIVFILYTNSTWSCLVTFVCPEQDLFHVKKG